jgi:hypothetical protein
LDTFQNQRFETWDEAAKFALSLKDGWVFRGQSCATWDLTTSLERAALSFDLSLSSLKLIESDLVHKFARHMHLYISNPPSRDGILEIMALMQHHGAPTRLLDWTYSVYAAGYFAYESNCKGADCVIWAVDYKWCNQESQRILKEEFGDIAAIDDEHALDDPTLFRNVFWDRQVPFVCQLTPHRLSQRLIIQQGTFLWPGDISLPFMENLRALPDAKNHVIRICVDGSPNTRMEALSSLYRMNMSSTTLFPGLDGFAASFRTELPFKWRRR